MTTDTRPDIPRGSTYGIHGNVLTFKNNSGYWFEYTCDAAGRVLTFKDSSGFWYEYTRDTHGRELTFKNSNAFWYEYTRDTHGNELTYENSFGAWYEYTHDTHGEELTFKNKTGLWTTLAVDLDYTLRHNAVTGIYWAGCRKFTAGRALDHWSVRDDARAMQFTAAILNHLGETE